MLRQSPPPPVSLDAPSGLAMARTTFPVPDLRLGVQLASLSFQEGRNPQVTVHFAGSEVTTPLVAPERGSFITAFTHNDKPYVVRFADFERKIVVLPAHNEEAGFSKPEQRFYVQTDVTKLDHILLTPFKNTGISRFLTRLAVENALASTGHANAHVGFDKMKRVLEDCGLVERFKFPHHVHVREATRQEAQEKTAQGYLYDLDSLGWLEDIIVLERSSPKAERELNRHWNLATTLRIFEARDGQFFEHRLPR
jgi:hypothetical protein